MRLDNFLIFFNKSLYLPEIALLVGGSPGTRMEIQHISKASCFLNIDNQRDKLYVRQVFWILGYFTNVKFLPFRHFTIISQLNVPQAFQASYPSTIVPSFPKLDIHSSIQVSRKLDRSNCSIFSSLNVSFVS